MKKLPVVLVTFLLGSLINSHQSFAIELMKPLLAPMEKAGGAGGGGPALPALAVDPFPVCNIIPTAAELASKVEINNSFISSSEALKLGLPIGSLSTSGNQMLMIQDYLRGKECLAKDGKTRVLYGQSIRTIIKLSDWDGKSGLSYPIIAADATLNHKNHELVVRSYGLINVKIDPLLASVSGKVFDVDTYSQYIMVQSELIKLMSDPGTKKTVERLGVVSSSHNDYKADVVTSYAIQQIKKQNSCLEAKKIFTKHCADDAGSLSFTWLIDSVYKHLTGDCSEKEPTEMNKLEAKGYLLGLSISYPWF